MNSQQEVTVNPEQKTNDDHEQVELDEYSPSYFSMLPNFVSSMPEVSHTSLRLYIHYVKICGHDKRRSCWMSVKTLAEQCFMDYKTVIKARDSLEKLKLITVIRQRMPNGSEKIIIKINNPWKRNHEFHTEGKQTIAPTGKQTIGIGKTNNRDRENKQSGRLENNQPINTNNTNNMKKNKRKKNHTPGVCSPPKGFALTGEDTTQGNKEITHGRVATDKLHGALQSKRKIMTRRPNLNHWGYTMDHFIDTSIVTVDEFNKVLEWYILHIGEQYVPRAYSAKSFCSEFVRISDAMYRDKKTKENKGKNKAQIRYDEQEKRLRAKGVI